MKRPPMPANSHLSAAAGLRTTSFQLICCETIDMCTSNDEQRAASGLHCPLHCSLGCQASFDVGPVYCKHVPCLHTAYSVWTCAPGEPIATRWNDRLKQEIKNSRVNMTNKLVVGVFSLCSRVESYVRLSLSGRLSPLRLCAIARHCLHALH